MVNFTATIHKFENKGEKTGWRYIQITADTAEELAPGVRKSFRIKGRIDGVEINDFSVLPMGDGSFILPLKAGLRKQLHKQEGSMVTLSLTADPLPYKLHEEMLACLEDSPEAFHFFNQLQPSHQRYFSKWIDSAKTDGTKARRIAQVVRAMQHNQSYSDMIRSNKHDSF